MLMIKKIAVKYQILVNYIRMWPNENKLSSILYRLITTENDEFMIHV